MAEVKGKLCSCDRCGETVFLKATGEGETDGGYTRWNKFESYPEGWKSRWEVGTLCPGCNALFDKLLAEFRKPLNEEETTK